MSRIGGCNPAKAHMRCTRHFFTAVPDCLSRGLVEVHYCTVDPGASQSATVLSL
ncbi:hypothetical protein C8Q73DRAFT_694576, partial [Cubamyces lactineus]